MTEIIDFKMKLFLNLLLFLTSFHSFLFIFIPAVSFNLSHLLHALLKERVPPGLADDEIGPLDDHDADKEAGVAGEFNDLPLLIRLQG